MKLSSISLGAFLVIQRYCPNALSLTSLVAGIKARSRCDGVREAAPPFPPYSSVNLSYAVLIYRKRWRAQNILFRFRFTLKRFEDFWLAKWFLVETELLCCDIPSEEEMRIR